MTDVNAYLLREEAVLKKFRQYRVSQEKVSIKNFNSDLFITFIHTFNFFLFNGSISFV